jgi:hypothetical protein
MIMSDNTTRDPFAPLPTAQQIALACQRVPDFSPMAELAKVAAFMSPHRGDGNIEGVYLTYWQKQIFGAQIMVLLGMDQ